MITESRITPRSTQSRAPSEKKKRCMGNEASPQSGLGIGYWLQAVIQIQQARRVKAKSSQGLLPGKH